LKKMSFWKEWMKKNLKRLNKKMKNCFSWWIYKENPSPKLFKRDFLIDFY